MERVTGQKPARRMPSGLRGALAAAGALAIGLWLGVAVGLATRPRKDQPDGPLVYDRTKEPALGS